VNIREHGRESGFDYFHFPPATAANHTRALFHPG
jgi:hypothetical protein